MEIVQLGETTVFPKRAVVLASSSSSSSSSSPSSLSPRASISRPLPSPSLPPKGGVRRGTSGTATGQQREGGREGRQPGDFSDSFSPSSFSRRGRRRDQGTGLAYLAGTQSSPPPRASSASSSASKSGRGGGGKGRWGEAKEKEEEEKRPFPSPTLAFL